MSLKEFVDDVKRESEAQISDIAELQRTLEQLAPQKQPQIAFMSVSINW